VILETSDRGKENAKRLDVLEDQSAIARAVADELRRRGPVVPLSWPVKLVGIAGSLVVIAGSIKGLVG